MPVIIITILIVNSIAVSQCQSPCPGFFRYLVDNRTREMFGRIEIPHPPRNIVLHLRVSLSVATILPTKYVGKIQLARSLKESIKAIENTQSLFYNIYFPLQRPVPLLAEILFNGHQYCIGRKAYGPIVTNMFLEHFLYPPTINTSAANDNNASSHGKLDIFPIFNDENHPIELSSPQPPVTFDVDEFSLMNNIKDCGKSRKSGQPMAASGARTYPGEWPWLAAIFTLEIDLEFLCAGNLITERHVITAARCKISKGSEIPSSILLISLGRYRLDDTYEHPGIMRQVEKFRMHPEFINKRSAHADLAIVVLKEPVPISSRIKPICLSQGSTALENVIGISGYVVGWGTDENGQKHYGGPRLAKVRVVSQKNCLRHNALFDNFNINKMLCASKGDGSGSCNGDIGSGLMVHDWINDIYYLRGIVSFSLIDTLTESCDLKHYSAYVDIAIYLEWIDMQIS